MKITPNTWFGSFKSFRTVCIIGTLIGMSTLQPLMAAELSVSVANRVHRAFGLQQDEKLAEAIEVLEKTTTSRSYDTAYVQRMLGILYWQNEQAKEAQTALTNAVESGGLPSDQQNDTERMLGDIHLMNGNYKTAIRYYQSVLNNTDLTHANSSELALDLYKRMAQAHYQMQSWDGVISNLVQFQKRQPALGISELNLRLGAQLAKKQWKHALTTTNQLLAIEPQNPQWWRQKTSLHLQLKQYQSALANLKQYQRAGFEMSTAQYKVLAQLYAYQGAPELAARTYQDSISEKDAQDWATTARYWQQAREMDQALNAWSQAKSLDSEHVWPYVELLMQQKQYQTALNEMEHIAKPSRQQWLAKTQAYYRLGNTAQAKSAATEAHKLKADAQSSHWLTYLETL